MLSHYTLTTIIRVPTSRYRQPAAVQYYQDFIVYIIPYI